MKTRTIVLKSARGLLMISLFLTGISIFIYPMGLKPLAISMLTMAGVGAIISALFYFFSLEARSYGK